MTDTPHHSLAVAALVVTVAVTTAAAPVVAATTGSDGSTLDSQEQPQVRLGSTTVDPGETTTVRLATDASEVAGYQANVTFDPDVLEVASVSGTESFGDPVVNANNDEGWVFVTQSQVEGTDEPALATITFAAVGDDGQRSSLGFVGADTVLNDADSTTVDVSLSPGEVTVAAGDAVASDADSDGDAADSQSAASSREIDAGASGGGGPLGGVDPVAVGGGAAVLGGTAAAGVYLGQRFG